MWRRLLIQKGIFSVFLSCVCYPHHVFRMQEQMQLKLGSLNCNSILVKKTGWKWPSLLVTTLVPHFGAISRIKLSSNWTINTNHYIVELKVPWGSFSPTLRVLEGWPSYPCQIYLKAKLRDAPVPAPVSWPLLWPISVGARPHASK